MFIFRHLLSTLNKSTPVVVTIPVVGFNYWSQQKGTNSLDHFWPTIQIRSAFGLRSAHLLDLSKKVMNSHVILKVHFTKADPELLRDYDGPNHMLGSGFIIHGQGLIVTTTSTVRNYAYVMVRLWDDNEFREVKGKVVDKAYEKGLALIQLLDDQNPDRNDWPTVSYATEYLQESPVGTDVYAVANPRFNYEMSVTKGIFTGVRVRGKDIGDVCVYDEPYIPHSATVASGDTGSALLDRTGRVIGMNFTQGIGRNNNFCLSYGFIEDYLSEQQRNGSLDGFKDDIEPRVGAIVYWMDATNRAQYSELSAEENKAIPNVNEGVLVWGVDVDSGCGLQRFDVITSIGDTPVTDIMQLYSALDKQTQVRVRFARNGDPIGQTTLAKTNIKWTFV